MKRVTLAAAVALLLAGTPDATAERITVGLTTLSPAALPLLVAEEQGYFREEGLEVALSILPSGTEGGQAVLSDAVQIALTSLTETLQLRRGQQDAQLFWGVSNRMPFRLYARPELVSVRDLRGKKLAVGSSGAPFDLLTPYALRRLGVSPREIILLPLGPTPARYAALKAGTVDATILWFPQAVVAEREGFRKLLDLAEVLPDWGEWGYAALAGFRTGQRDAVVRYLRAHQRGLRDVKENAERGIGILVRKLGYPRDVAEAGYREYVPSFPDDGRVALEGFRVFLEQEKQVGRLEGHWTVEDLLDRSYVELFGRKEGQEREEPALPGGAGGGPAVSGRGF